MPVGPFIVKEPYELQLTSGDVPNTEIPAQPPVLMSNRPQS